jgi:phosphatidate cytidylyltransferase
MPFNLQTFKTRTLTAAIFVVVMLAGLFVNQWTFFILFSVIHFGCWMEYQRLVGLIDKNYQQITPLHKYGVMIAGWCLMLHFADDSFSIGSFTLNEYGWWLGLIFLVVPIVIEALFTKRFYAKNVGHSCFGLIYISLSLGLLMDLYGYRTPSLDESAYYVPCIIIFSIWVNDTMAYIVGSFIGKTPLSSISPKKTWEGTIGGIILAIVVAVVYVLITKETIYLVIITASAAIAGTFGDLFESKLKRLAGVKDSGHIMPGHGGFLDRFDSLLVAIPLVWVFVWAFLRAFIR